MILESGFLFWATLYNHTMKSKLYQPRRKIMILQT